MPALREGSDAVMDHGPQFPGIGPKVCDHDEACGCYVEGYVAGMRMMITQLQDVYHRDWADCGCDRCRAVRAVVEAAQGRMK